MKILDKYVAKNFLIGYLIAFFVLIGLRVVIDLFLNLDEFAEHAELGTLAVLKNIVVFYGIRCTVYFRDFAGVITVVAAVFSLSKMVRSGELIAVTASGVSLKRVISPIIVLALFLTVLLVVDQEFIIPPLSDELVRSQDYIPGEEHFNVRFLMDGKGSLIHSPRFDVKTSTFHKVDIITRRPTTKEGIWAPVGWIYAETAVFDKGKGDWDLEKGRFVEMAAHKGSQPISEYKSDLTPEQIPIMRKSKYKSLLSFRQLGALARQRKKINDLAELYSQKHFRVTEPIINLIMLLISLPILVCRDPRAMKSAIAISFGTTAACYITAFVCKILATEVIFDRVRPELWAWLPVVIFLPIAFFEFDSMKT